MDKAKNNWESIYQSIGNDIPKTDDWLDKYDKQIAQSKDTPIIDLGCGFGNDTLYLTRQGYKVISCDYSKKALMRFKHFINDPDCRCLDMRENLPFDSQSARIIICDLSLHYFSEADTVSLIKEIKRVLFTGGHLLCRVNSVSELSNETAKVVELEKNYFQVGERKKRYFDMEDVDKFFCDFSVEKTYEYIMNRYRKPKFVLDFAVKKI